MPVSGSLVWVSPRLKNDPPSLGQVNSAGSWSRSTSSPVRTTSCTGPSFTFFGGTCVIAPSFPNASRTPTNPCGSSGFSSPPIRSEISAYDFRPRAFSSRRSVPYTFIASGMRDPRTFSKRSAGPPAFCTRSTISPTSRYGSTSALMRFRSPSRSSALSRERRSS